MHGALQDPIAFAQMTGFPALAQREGLALVVPETFDGHWNDGRRIVFFGMPSMVDDVGFLQQVMADLVADGTALPDAIYLAGFSNGGLMALTLACRPSPVRPAGIVTAAATLRTALARDCRPPKPLAVVTVNGTADGLFPFAGGMGMVNGRTGEAMLSAAATADLFAASNGCGLQASDRVSGSVEIRDYRGCPSSGSVLQLALIAGGHLWPADPSAAFGTAAGLDSPATLAELAWTVFDVGAGSTGQLPGDAARISTSPPVAPASTP